MPNAIDAKLGKAQFLNIFLSEFVAKLMPLTGFSTDFSPDPISKNSDRGSKTVDVGYIPTAAGSEDFNGSYTSQDTQWLTKSVVVEKHKFVEMNLTDTEVADKPSATFESQAKAKAYALAKDVVLDILGSITVANYGVGTNVGASSAFDLDDIADLGDVLDQRFIPDSDRSIILKSTYHSAVAKDNNMQDVSAAGTDSAVRRSVLPMIHGFTPYKSVIVPDNGENLIGLATHPSAMAVAMRYLKPQEGHKYNKAVPLTDSETGITVGFRDWYDENAGQRRQIFECNYGFEVIEADSLERLTSA